MTVTAKKFRIDFQVREVMNDDEDPTDARYVTFGDEVPLSKLKDFFERCGISVDLMFKGMKSASYLRLTNSDMVTKIQAIKALRSVTGISLKEAKDRIEMPAGTPLVFFSCSEDAEVTIQAFKMNGVDDLDFALEAYDPSVIDLAGVPNYRDTRFA